MTFPFIREAVESGDLTLHGLWNDLSDGSLRQYDPAVDGFVPVRAPRRAAREADRPAVCHPNGWSRNAPRSIAAWSPASRAVSASSAQVLPHWS